MLKGVVAVVVAGAIAAMLAIATRPVVVVGAAEPNRIGKGDRLDARVRERRSIQPETQPQTSSSPRQRPRIRVVPAQPRGEVRIASFSLRLADAGAT